MKKVIVLVWICISCATAKADTKWELKKDKDGIQVYTGSVPNSNIKAVKVICTVEASLSQMVALLLDTKAHEQWVYNTKTSYLVKQLGPGHQVYYSEVSMPWPLSNRDVVSDLVISQDGATKVLYVVANTAEHYVPEIKDKVRVPVSKVSWKVTPAGTNRLNVEYTGQADPGGEIPAWLVNSFSTKGPFETFKKFREAVMSSNYKNAHYDFIKD